MNEPAPKGIKPPGKNPTSSPSPLENAANRVAQGGNLTPEEELGMLGKILAHDMNTGTADPVHKLLGKGFLKRHPEMADKLAEIVGQQQNTDPEPKQKE